MTDRVTGGTVEGRSVVRGPSEVCEFFFSPSEGRRQPEEIGPPSQLGNSSPLCRKGAKAEVRLWCLLPSSLKLLAL